MLSALQTLTDILASSVGGRAIERLAYDRRFLLEAYKTGTGLGALTVFARCAQNTTIAYRRTKHIHAASTRRPILKLNQPVRAGTLRCYHLPLPKPMRNESRGCGSLWNPAPICQS
ncbi:hypothetical protein TcWFU_008759 [Taenia crassiceps]|uniref:Uncharacterized protein n=1 Tax=Taenia crassiceps TaxID=6207 RepID=A0ABR4QER8_9CEST